MVVVSLVASFELLQHIYNKYIANIFDTTIKKKENNSMSLLFTDNFPEIKTNKELEKVKTKFTNDPYKYDDYYIVSGCLKERRDKFEILWKTYEKYADKHFKKQFKKDFHSRTWEMYLGNIFLKNNIKIIEPKKEGPDIKMEVSGKNIWVEAVTTKTNKKNEDILKKWGTGKIAYDIPHDEMILRLTNSFTSKWKEYRKNIEKGIIQEDEPYIIAINRGIFPYPDPDVPLIFKPLFGLGYFTLSIDLETKERESYMSKKEHVEKQNESKVTQDLFKNSQYEGVSAVIYSIKDVLNSPKKIGSDCMLIHNPMAKNKIDHKTLNFLEQWEWITDKERGEIRMI